MAEKQRRDNLNTNISTMAALVPIVAGSSRRMDKISILRLAAAFLRTQYTLGSGAKTGDFLPPQFNDFDLEQYFVDHIVDSGGFFLVVTTTGKIVYVSRQVEQHLGHVQNEMLGQSLYSFVYPEDHDELTRNLTPEDAQPATGVAQVSEHDNSCSSTEEDTTASHKPCERLRSFREQRRKFTIRLAQRTVSKRNTAQYECFDISGVLRLADACKNANLNGNKGKYRETSTSNDIVFTGIATLPKKRPITELSILDINKDEYVTRHLVDGRIIFCDHRISLIAGYMSEEVSGENAFKFMHKDDFRWTMIGLRQMYDRAETYGSSCYRLFTKNGGFIYLRTHGYLEFDKDTQTVESFVCVNTLVSETEGVMLIKEMKDRFSAIVSPASKGLIPNLDSISSTDLDSSASSCPESNLETRQKIEDAINHLISDLPSPAMSEERFTPSPMPDTQFVKAAIFSSRMPSAAAQASKIGIKKINRYVLNGKRNRTLSQDSNDHTLKLFSPSSAEQSPISDTESAKGSGKNLAMLNMKSAHDSVSGSVHNVQSASASMQSNVLAASSCATCNPVSCRNAPPQIVNILKQERVEQQCGVVVNMLSPDPAQEGAVRPEHKPEAFNKASLIKQEPPVLQYYDDNTNDTSSVISSGLISPGVEPHNRGPLKRICSEEDVTTAHSKRRPNDVYASTNDIGEQQGASYLKCKIYATENKYPAFPAGLSQYSDISPQPLLMESPNPGLNEVNAENYQHLADPLIAMHPDDEQFDDVLLSPELKNPELMMKIFDNLRTEPVPNLNYESFNEAQLLSDDQAVNDQIRRTYDQLANSMAFRESQINGLKHELEHKLLSAQRENLSQLQAEHKQQMQMLRNLQQDHRKMQLNTKHTHGV